MSEVIKKQIETARGIPAVQLGSTPANEVRSSLRDPKELASVRQTLSGLKDKEQTGVKTSTDIVHEGTYGRLRDGMAAIEAYTVANHQVSSPLPGQALHIVNSLPDLVMTREQMRSRLYTVHLALKSIAVGTNNRDILATIRDTNSIVKAIYDRLVGQASEYKRFREQIRFTISAAGDIQEEVVIPESRPHKITENSQQPPSLRSLEIKKIPKKDTRTSEIFRDVPTRVTPEAASSLRKVTSEAAINTPTTIEVIERAVKHPINRPEFLIRYTYSEICKRLKIVNPQLDALWNTLIKQPNRTIAKEFLDTFKIAILKQEIVKDDEEVVLARIATIFSWLSEQANPTQKKFHKKNTEVIKTPTQSPEPIETTQNRAPAWANTLKNFGQKVKSFFSRATTTPTKSNRPRAAQSTWFAIGMAGVMSLFGKKVDDMQIQAARDQNQPEIMTVTPDVQMTFKQATGSVRAGLSDQDSHNASVQRGVENALDGVDGQDMLLSLYPGTTLTPEVHTYLSDTIAQRIQTEIDGKKLNLHTRTNRETVTIDQGERNANGTTHFTVTLNRGEHHYNGEVDIRLPTTDQINRYAALHTAAILQRQATEAAQEAKVATAATNAAGVAREADINAAFGRTVEQPTTTVDPAQTAIQPNNETVESQATPTEARTERQNPVRLLSVNEATTLAQALQRESNPAQAINFQADGHNNESTLSLTVGGENNSVTMTFDHLVLINGQVYCIQGDHTLPLADALQTALAHTQVSGAAGGFARQVREQGHTLSQPSTSAAQTIQAPNPQKELDKLARVDRMKAEARAKLDAYYAERDRLRTQARNNIRQTLA